MTMTLNKNRLFKLTAIGAMVALLAVVAATLQDSEALGAATDSTAICHPSERGNGTTSGDPVEFDLTASSGYVGMPDGNSILMWSYESTTGGAFQSPGPTLCVDSGQWVQVNLLSDLAIAGTPVSTSVVFPGQSAVSTLGGTAGLFTAEAISGGGSVSYTFQASEPGTYLYESGTDQIRQIQMGLFGGLIVRPAANAGWAYDDPDTAFDADFEYLLLLHEIDPVLHQLVENGASLDSWDPTVRHNRYWTINGRSFPDVIAPNNAPWLPNQPYGAMVQIEANPLDAGHPQYDANRKPALVRYANAGLDNHPFHPHGNHLRIIGKDGRSLGTIAGDGVLDGTVEAFSKTVAAGSTYELLAEWRDVDAWVNDETLVPVTVPGLEDIVFKDGATWYSGSVELGDTGEFQGGTTSFSECGEYYFPWHSHALNEVQNFDEGFGGMLTLWRVDPPGGCGAA